MFVRIVLIRLLIIQISEDIYVFTVENVLSVVVFVVNVSVRRQICKGILPLINSVSLLFYAVINTERRRVNKLYFLFLILSLKLSHFLNIHRNLLRLFDSLKNFYEVIYCFYLLQLNSKPILH